MNVRIELASRPTKPHRKFILPACGVLLFLVGLTFHLHHVRDKRIYDADCKNAPTVTIPTTDAPECYDSYAQAIVDYDNGSVRFHDSTGAYYSGEIANDWVNTSGRVYQLLYGIVRVYRGQPVYIVLQRHRFMTRQNIVDLASPVKDSDFVICSVYSFLILIIGPVLWMNRQLNRINQRRYRPGLTRMTGPIVEESPSIAGSLPLYHRSR